MIIGITGTLGAGKGTVVDILKKKGFNHYSVREFLTEEIKKRGLSVNRDSMVSVANQIRKVNGPSYIIEKLYEKASSDKYAIIESIRTIGEAEKIKEFGGTLLAVDANPETRYSRVLSRQSETDNISFEKFLEDEKREMFSANPHEQNLTQCRNLADYVINNDKTIDFLEKQVDEIITKIMYSSSDKEKPETSETEDKEETLTQTKEKLYTETDITEKSQVNEKPKKSEKRTDYISWDEYFMGVAVLSAMRSKDPNTQIGACIIDEKKHIVATGYNGFPMGCSDDELPWGRIGEKTETKYPYVVHAEQNAITNATKVLDGCKIYLPLFPCNECAKLIIQSGITDVIYISDKYAELDEYKASRRILEMSGVRLRQYTPKDSRLIINFDKIN